MSRNKRSIIPDSSYFRDIRVAKVNNSFFDEEEDEEKFYEKGKTHSSKVRFEGKDKIILSGKKGESDIHIDLGNTRRIIRTLRDHHVTDYVHDLRGDVKENFLSLHELVDVLSNTPAYKYLHEMITSEFRCADEHRYRMGTVGAYFCECQQPTNFPGNPACSLGCLLGLQPDGGCKGYYPCEYTCVIYNGDETFSVLHRATDTSQAYLFVNDKFTFRGLTRTEVTKMESMGIVEVKVVNHSDGLSYQEISADFVPVRRLGLVTVSGGHSDGFHGPENHGTGAGIVLAVVLIIFLILLLGGGYWFYHKHGMER